MTSGPSKRSAKQPELSDEELRLLMEEVGRRQELKKNTHSLSEEIYAELFSQQLDFVKDPSKRKATLGSRRAGKTNVWTRHGTVVALENPRTVIRIWHQSRLRAKEMLWSELTYLHQRHGIKTHANETTLTITFENGSEIRLVGADKDKEAQKKRGDKTILEIILEAQLFGGFLRSMIEDVIDPSLVDLQGTICIEGTPGPLCQGVWYEISGDDNYSRRWTAKKGGWSCHRWTLLDNPHIPHARAYLAQKKLERNWSDDNPTYLREYCGQWVNDLTSLFYKFDLTRNTYSPTEVTPYGPGWSHVLGWDLGGKDDMAVVIWGWHPDHRELYEAFSWKKSGALAAEVMAVIDMAEKQYNLNLIECVADTGGGGRMYVDEVMSRYTRRFTAAKKTEKYEHVRLFSDEMLTGHIKLKLGSQYQTEIAALMRDPEWPPPEKPDENPREAPSCANHCSDAGLYAWRAAAHYHVPYEKPKIPAKAAGQAWIDLAVSTLDKKGLNKQKDELVAYGFGALDHEIES